MKDSTILLILIISTLVGTFLFGATEARWDYPVDATDVSHFNVYATTNLSQPFVVVEQIAYTNGHTGFWSSTAWNQFHQCFYKVSAVGTNGLESFAIR